MRNYRQNLLYVELKLSTDFWKYLGTKADRPLYVWEKVVITYSEKHRKWR